MEWCGFVLWEYYTKREKEKKSPVRIKEERRKRRTSAGLSRRMSSRCSRQFFIWNQMAHFARRHSLQNSIDTNQLFLRTRGCFHCPTLKKLKQKTLKDCRNVVLSHWPARFIDARSRGQTEWRCSCSVSLGYQIGSSLGFYFGKSLGLKSSRTKNICDVGQRMQHGGHRACTQPSQTSLLSSAFASFICCKKDWKMLCGWNRQRAWSPVSYMFAMAKNAPGLEPRVAHDKSASSKFLSCVLFKKANAFWIGNTEPGRQKVWVNDQCLNEQNNCHSRNTLNT